MTGANEQFTAVSSRAKRRFPDHSLNTAPFRVCLPVYELRLKVTELAEDSLSTAARYVLQLSDLGITTPADLARTLGIAGRFVVHATAELLGANLVVQSPDLRIEITEQGREVLRNGGRSLRPRNRYVKVPYDPLTKKIIDLDIDLLLDRNLVRKNGFFIPPTSPRRPRLNHLHVDEVRDYVRFYEPRNDKVEILDVSEIRDIRLRYRDDVIVVKLDPPYASKPTFAACKTPRTMYQQSAKSPGTICQFAKVYHHRWAPPRRPLPHFDFEVQRWRTRRCSEWKYRK